MEMRPAELVCHSSLYMFVSPCAAGHYDDVCATVLPVVAFNGAVIGGQVLYKGGQRVVTSSPELQQTRGLLTGATKNTFSTLRSMQELYLLVIYPFFLKRCQTLGVDVQQQKMIILLDHYSVHLSYRFLHWVSAFFPNWIHVFVPRNCTAVSQPCDLNVMGPLKAELNIQKGIWMRSESLRQVSHAATRNRALAVRQGYGKCVKESFKRVLSGPMGQHTILKSFEMAGITRMYPRRLHYDRSLPPLTPTEQLCIQCLHECADTSPEIIAFKPWEGLQAVHNKLLARKRCSGKCNDMTPVRTFNPKEKGYTSEVDLDRHPWPQTTTIERVRAVDGASWRSVAAVNSAVFDMFGDGALIIQHPPSTRPSDKKAAKARRQTTTHSRNEKVSTAASAVAARGSRQRKRPRAESITDSESGCDSDEGTDNIDKTIAAELAGIGIGTDEDYAPVTDVGYSPQTARQRSHRQVRMSQKAEEGYPSSDSEFSTR